MTDVEIFLLAVTFFMVLIALQDKWERKHPKK